MTLDEQLEVEHHFSHGMYAKRMTLKEGFVIGTHKHNFTHMSILAKGTARVEAGGESKIYEAGDCIEIAANVEHRIFALEDIVWFCIHATDVTDPELIDETLIKD
jgi:quercetin dioxygenase-like cupin family protein